MSDLRLAELLADLEIVALDRLSEGRFTLLSKCPVWFSTLCSGIPSDHSTAIIVKQLTFLEDFLPLAEEFWMTHERGILKSDPWKESELAGRNLYLEAAAVSLGQAKILLIESLGSKFEEKQALLQKARESQLALHHLQKELHNQQAVIRGVAYDLKEYLSGLKHFLTLLNPEKLGAEERQFLEISKRQVRKIDSLSQELIVTPPSLQQTD